MAEKLRIESANRVARVMFDRPPLNILDIGMVAEVAEQLVRLPAQHEFIVFQGMGANFSGGADVADHTPDRVGRLLGAFHRVFHEMGAGHAVTIAAVDGHCLGGACELAVCCDFVLATESATFGFPEIKLGCFPPIAMVVLPRMMPGHAAFDLILTGRTIKAREAANLGMVTRVVPDGELAGAVDGLLGEMRQLSPPVLRLTRRLTRLAGFHEEEVELKEIENMYLEELIRTQDAQEGVRAFMEKRAPVWTGR